MRDTKSMNVVVYSRQTKAQKMLDYLQQQNPKMQIEITEDIPAPALARALKAKQDDGQDKKEEPIGKAPETIRT